jgi:hypothetical protein
VGQVVFHQAFAVLGSRRGVDTARDVVPGGGVTPRTVEILTVQPHVHVQLLVGFCKGGVEVAVLDAVTSAAEKVTGPAVSAGGTGDTLSDFVPVRREILFAVSRKNHGLGGRIPRTCRKFLVGAGLLVADKAVDLGLVTEVEVLVFPSVAGVT